MDFSDESLHHFMKKLAPVTPGELLLEEFLISMCISRYRLAKEIDLPPQRIGDIVSGKRAVTADTDLRLCRFFLPVQRLQAPCAGRP
jgi:addiction module HigA family antidote